MEEELFTIKRRIRPNNMEIDEFLRKSHVLLERGVEIFYGSQNECVYEKVRREEALGLRDILSK